MGYQQEYNVICDNRFKAGSNFFLMTNPPKKILCGWVPSEIFLVENWELEALRTKVRVVAQIYMKVLKMCNIVLIQEKLHIILHHLQTSQMF